jgi:hypothetical protein
MPGFNLVRNSRLFFTSNVAAATGIVSQGTLTSLATNGVGTQEIAVMNGFSFSQATASQTITVSEAGNTPTRGQRAFNTALQAVDFKFTTYIRPRGANATTDMDEKVLWNALLSDGAVNLAPTGVTQAGSFSASAATIARTGTTNVVTYTWTAIDISTVPGFALNDRVNVGGVVNTGGLGFNGSGVITTVSGSVAACTGVIVTMDIAPDGTGNPSTTTGTIYFSKQSALLRNAVAGTEAAHVMATVGLSGKNQLQKFGLVVIVDQATYIIDNAALDQAIIDFGIDGIASVEWTGKGTVLRVLATGTGIAGTFGGSLTGSYTAAAGPTVSAGNFITKKLSTATLASTFRGKGTSAKVYTVAITGGTVTIANNITYVTPDSLGVVNVPIGYFTGTRAISGSITAYLKTGAGNTTNTLLTDLLAANAETKYFLELQLGGANNSVKVEFEFPTVTLQVPTVDVKDVVSTSISFVAQGAQLPDSSATALADASATSYYDVEALTDMIVRYYSV